jgi:hypothetical protein
MSSSRIAKQKKILRERVEQLECRLLWSVGMDGSGWTVVNEPSAKVIYVSAEGSDSNNGLSPAAPVQTFAKAESMIQSGVTTQVLLKSGDTFHDTFQNWTYSGADAQDPDLISYYGGGARPLIYTDKSGTGFSTQLYSSNGATVNYLDVIGLQFEANLRDPTLQTVSTSTVGGAVGFKFYANGGNVLVEDCSFNYYQENFDIESLGSTAHPNPSISNFEIRRSVVDNAYAFNGGRSQGLYAFNINGLSVIQSVFDHNGWNANLYLGAADLGYNHDLYIASTCSNVTVQGCVIAEASFAGINGRAGGNIDNNIFIDDPVAVTFGAADGADSTIGGVSGSLTGNVVVGDRASQTITYSKTAYNGLGGYVVGSGLAYGLGFVIANTKPGADVTVSNNIFTQDSQNAKPAIQLEVPTGTSNPSQAVGINDLTISGNIIYGGPTGYRIGIQTDGRFVPGGSGIYALNDLKVTGNDFVNNTTQEVRHDGGLNSQEIWSSNRYYDPTLAQSKWITVQGAAMAFSTWQSTVDKGATVLTTLPYANPNVTAGTYDATVGGPGTWQDYVAQAKSLSISNYQPQYMAQAAVSYIDAGFNVSSTYTVNGPGTPPAASASAQSVNTSSLGATTYSFTVNYTDGAILNTSSFGNANLLVSGPNGFSEFATYVSAGTPTIDAAGYEHLAVTYQITPPAGIWLKGQDGTYNIELMPNQVTDTAGNTSVDALIGSFGVNFTLPTAVASAVTNASGSSTYSFSVTYADAAGIDMSTLNSFQVQVSGGSNFSHFATLGTVTSASGSVVANYSVSIPNAAGTYTVSMLANSVYDLAGNAVAAGVLTTFGTPLNTASISGSAFNDANGNGVFDSRENALTGVTIFIDQAGTGVWVASDPTATTDVNGNYTFSNLSAGRYTVMEIVPIGYTASSPSSASTVLTLTAGQAASGINFADQLGNTVVSGTGGATSGGGSTSGTGHTSGTGSFGSAGNGGSTSVGFGGYTTGTISGIDNGGVSEITGGGSNDGTLHNHGGVRVGLASR